MNFNMIKINRKLEKLRKRYENRPSKWLKTQLEATEKLSKQLSWAYISVAPVIEDNVFTGQVQTFGPAIKVYNEETGKIEYDSLFKYTR